MPKLIYCQDVYSDAPPPMGRGTPNTPEGALIGDFLDNGTDTQVVMTGGLLWSLGSSVSPYIRSLFEEKDRLARILEDADKSINRVEGDCRKLEADLTAANATVAAFRDLHASQQTTMAPPSGVEEFVGWVERIGKVFR